MYRQHVLFLGHRARMYTGSTVGITINVKNILCKYEVPTKMCHGRCLAVNKFITTTGNNNVSVDNKMHVSIIHTRQYIVIH